MVAKIKKVPPSDYIIYNPSISRFCQGVWKKNALFFVKICNKADKSETGFFQGILRCRPQRR